MNNSATPYSFNSFPSLLNSELLAREVINIEGQSIAVKPSQLLKDSEHICRLVTEVVSEGVWVWDLASDFVDYSSSWKSMLGYGEGEIQHSPLEWLVRIHPADVEKVKSYLAQCWHGKIDSFEVEYSVLHRDGQYR